MGLQNFSYVPDPPTWFRLQETGREKRGEKIVIEIRSFVMKVENTVDSP